MRILLIVSTWLQNGFTRKIWKKNEKFLYIPKKNQRFSSLLICNSIRKYQTYDTSAQKKLRKILGIQPIYRGLRMKLIDLFKKTYFQDWSKSIFYILGYRNLTVIQLLSTVIDEFDFLQQVDPEKVSFLTLSTINRIRFIWLNHQKLKSRREIIVF